MSRKHDISLISQNKISLSALNEELRASYQLVKESEVYNLFADCEHGAIPPVAEAYNMPMVCDSTLDSLDNVYIEAGDHETLLRLDHKNFANMMATGRHIRFSKEVFH
jgi:Ala-tRNA(Pro) deacylase